MRKKLKKKIKVIRKKTLKIKVTIKSLLLLSKS